MSNFDFGAKHPFQRRSLERDPAGRCFEDGRVVCFTLEEMNHAGRNCYKSSSLISVLTLIACQNGTIKSVREHSSHSLAGQLSLMNSLPSKRQVKLWTRLRNGLHLFYSLHLHLTLPLSLTRLRCFSSSRKNCMGVVLGGTSRMTSKINYVSTYSFSAKTIPGKQGLSRPTECNAQSEPVYPPVPRIQFDPSTAKSQFVESLRWPPVSGSMSTFGRCFLDPISHLKKYTNQ
ncbi:hypothetical protein TIFTF001_041177 [Ficus carica]|uniref:Uncharacterized protein n=1 Tax=Ficus carica TaxID=3494 RepID=A0AA87Z9U7_FICCA|nr:hypothetical protein TIFTF001_041177 [Ficus carica]